MSAWVLWLSTSRLSTTRIRDSAAFCDSADFKALRFSPAESRLVQSLGTGPQTMPPLRHLGFRMSPVRARPVPFWRQSFFPEPETSARVLVFEVPRRRDARYDWTAVWIRCSL